MGISIPGGALAAGAGLLGSLLSGVTRVQLIQNNSTVIQLDASLKETHSRDSPASEFPIETGANISDNVLIKPFHLEINGIITDTPLGGTAGLLTEVATSAISSLVPPAGLAAVSAGVALLSGIVSSQSPSVAAYVQLLELQTAAQPFDVLTSLYRYPNMWITNLSAPRDVGTGKALIFTIQLSQLLLVSPQSVNVQILANPGLAGSIADQGQQSTGISQFAQGEATSSGALSAAFGGKTVAH